MANRNMETSIGCRTGTWRLLLDVEKENGDFYWMKNRKMETSIGCRIGKWRLLLDVE